MKHLSSIIFSLISLMVFSVLMFACFKKSSSDKNTIIYKDFPQIQATGEITAITLSSSVSYFNFKGEEMGYEFDLIKSFAESNHLKLNIKIAENEKRLTEMLKNGEGDIVVYNIPITNELKDSFIYCGNERIGEQVLVQSGANKDSILHDVTQLIGKEVWVLGDTKYQSRMENLNNELGGGIIIKEIEKDTVVLEDLIEMVSNGTIKYAVSDKDVALLNKTYYWDLNVSLRLSHPQRSAWVVNTASPLLAKAVTDWFATNENTVQYKSIEKKYFEMSKMPGDGPAPILHAGVISPYDDLFKEYAPKIDWDWRLLASIAYQESKFKLDREAWTGAAGLMGLMPKTAEAYGITAAERIYPEPSVKAGVNLIKGLMNTFKDIENKDEQVKFILAAYNAGSGQILDGQALAKKHGKNPNVWHGNVEECLHWKRLPEYYNDPVCKFGYFRGTETINYVENVVERWHYYQTKVSK